MSMPLKLAYKHAFGVHGPVRNNVEIITAQDEHGSPKDHLLYPVGQHLALLRLDDHEMKFLSLKGVKEKGAREIVRSSNPCRRARGVAKNGSGSALKRNL